MQLDTYLARARISSRDFSKQIRVSIHAVAKWRQQLRIPRKVNMAKISKITRGKVSYKDWY